MAPFLASSAHLCYDTHESKRKLPIYIAVYALILFAVEWFRRRGTANH